MYTVILENPPEREIVNPNMPCICFDPDSSFEDRHRQNGIFKTYAEAEVLRARLRHYFPDSIYKICYLKEVS